MKKRNYLIFFIIILAFFVVEGTLRIKSRNNKLKDIHNYYVFDLHGFYRMEPNIMGCYRPVDNSPFVVIKTNSIGIRGEELLENPKKRILFFGDSVVMNLAVPQENTIVGLVEKLLNNNRSERKNFDIEVLNFATVDVGLDHYYSKLKYQGIGLQPNYIFLGFYLNDNRPSQGYLAKESADIIERAFEIPIIREFELFYQLKKIYRIVKYISLKNFKNRFRWVKRFNRRKYYSDKNEFLRLIEEADMDWGSVWIEESWRKIYWQIKRIRDLCLLNGIKLIVFCFPVEPQVYSQIDDDVVNFPQKKLLEVCKKLEIPCYDLLPSLRERNNEKIFLDHCHYNEYGSKVVAESIYNIIKNDKKTFRDLLVNLKN